MTTVTDGSPLQVENLRVTLVHTVYGDTAQERPSGDPGLNPGAQQALLDALAVAAKANPYRSLVDIIDSALYSEGYKSLDDWLVELGDAKVAEMVAAHYPGG